MGALKELYLIKENISQNNWLDLINIISDYNGFLRKWQLIITLDKNIIKYYVNTKCNLPATINNLDLFLLKNAKLEKKINHNYTLFFQPKIGSNIIDLINYFEIKNKGNLIYIKINFIKLTKSYIKSKITFFIKKNTKIIKYKVLISNPSSFLAIDFLNNKRFFYEKAPKYLEIKKVIHLLNTDSNNALLLVDTFPYLQGNFYLNESNFSFDKHSLIIGSSGSGKSKFISLLINNIYKNTELNLKYKVVVIDPHAALESDIGGIGKVIDFREEIDSIDLFINDTEDIIASTELMLDLFKSLLLEQYNSKLERVLRYSIHLLLTNKSFNFSNLRKVILDLEYRNKMIKELKYNLPISVIDFFLSDFSDLKTKSYGEAISPIISFIDEMELIPVFNIEQNNNNLKDTINNNFLTLFSLDRTKLGDKVTKTISGLIMGELLTLIEKENINEHIILIIDEVAVIENPILAKYLSEARKYNLSLILAGQYFNQITDELKNSIFANVINYFIFRVSKLDANILVDNFNMKIPLDDTKERKIKLLTELNNRECIARIDSNGVLLPAFKSSTLEFTSIPYIRPPKNNKNISNNNINNKKTNFSLSNSINLKDILISNSTNKEGV